MQRYGRALSIAIAGLSLIATSAFAQQKVVLKASDVHPAGYPTVVAVENMGKKLEAATNGRISVQMFPSMQLGGEKEAIDQALIMKFGREAQLEERALWTKYENDAMEKAKAAGIQITQINDKAPFQDAVKPVWDKYGPKYAEIIKRIEAVE